MIGGPAKSGRSTVLLNKARRGILLSPQDSSAGELIGIRTTRSMVGGPIAPGKGMLHLGSGEHMTVTTPL